MARPILHNDEVRSRLLEEAAALVAARGVALVSLRDIASAAGTSTAAIYSLFGGKRELLTAVVDDGFASFAASQAAAAPEGLLSLGRAYRRWALEHPSLYSLMFTGSLGGVVDCPPTPEVANDAISPLVAAVTSGLSASGSAEPPAAVAGAIWGQVHGLVGLELANTPLPGGDWAQAYEVALRGIARAYLEA
ncbi:TetR family transcriptional regulator [Arthrobacter sp. ERGS1:01]|uniref:TetR-like C-terminal domain-containing protein n=1 Tax=Arthrobacter sp. ERGS1:01 TaxID=1704044 RepID=UPI0006CB0271|nr:TetR-like C-terminal domain-containing protein [Arthrobacter sp. ERGS1:01]ALE07851.1 TetR family transcriptional regulator [Arthrobacter sp. ERGS1:01]